MAFTQTAANKKADFTVIHKDDDGYYYFDLGGVHIYVGAGDPNGLITAPKGSMAFDTDTPAFHINQNASTSWNEVTDA